MNHDFPHILSLFDIPGSFVSVMPYGSGHINDTYAMVVDQAGTRVRYIFQRINHDIFKDPVQLMSNISRVTRHLADKLRLHPDASRRTLTVLPSRTGQSYVLDEVGLYWRAYVFIENAKTYDAVENETQAKEAARSFGLFQRLLVDLPGPPLFESIPDFHNTPKRFARLLDAITTDMDGRVATARPEIEFMLQRESDVHRLINFQQNGDIPMRITHNDTKLNNVMLDDQSGEGICVIDLDTVMPGMALYDFGDLVRTATSPVMEDERDLSLVHMQMPMFSALVHGYLENAGAFLNEVEVECLPFAGKLITMETGIRFLTDYLCGDAYFKIHRSGHNLDRCRTQCRLVQSIELQSGEMTDEVYRIMGDVKVRVAR